MTSSIQSSSNRKGNIPTQLGKNIAQELIKVCACEERLQQALQMPVVGDSQIIDQMRASLSSPQQIIDISKSTGRFLIGMNVSKAAKKRVEIRKAAERLNIALTIIFDRLQNIKIPATNANGVLSELQNNLNLYHLTLQCVSAQINFKSSETLSLSRVVTMMINAAAIAESLCDIPTQILTEFDEELYLKVNSDVVDSIAKGSLASGMEHYVFFGAKEISDGLRRLRPIKVANSSFSHTVTPKFYDYDEVLDIVRRAKIVDEEWYCKMYGPTENPVEDFCKAGIHQGKNPCYYFDTAWYLANYIDVPKTGIPAVVHYIQYGEKEGRNPSQAFDSAWYASSHSLKTGNGLVLSHFLRKGRASHFSPNKLFDPEFYLKNYKDIADAGIDPAEHYFSAGWLEGRNPSRDFDTQFYIDCHLDGDKRQNPLLHYMSIEHKSGIRIHGRRKQDGVLTEHENISEANTSDVTRFFANPGPDFEEADISSSNPEAKARTIAFYLPQFYAFEENDQWWGKGFTEWRNVMRGSPRFEGHYQPRIPRDLGFYDLQNESTIVEQAELAMKNGIEGFCFYYYWFNGKRLMDKPLDLFANSKKIDTPFCIMWANENWTRTWDGLDKEVLINQDYSCEDEDDFIADTLVYFKNKKYISIQGRPLFVLYRPSLVPSGKDTFARWKKKWKAELGVEPWIMMVQGFGDTDPGVYGLDGAVEFPPHKICENLKNINQDLKIIDKSFKGHAVSYDDVVKRSLSEIAPSFPLIKTVSPHWDNDARREGRGFVMQGSTPEKYEGWLKGAVNYARKNPFEGESFVFVNAWNEWAEGAYLEPDVHYGHAYLNATRRAIYGEDSEARKKPILLVGHDAWPHGAQMLLLNMAKTFSMQFGMQVLVVLQKSGSLISEYEKYATVRVLERDGVDNTMSIVERGGFKHAITNTSVTGDVVPLLKEREIKVVSLIHELPRLITEYGLEDSVKKIAELSDHVVFPAEFVQKGFSAKAGEILGEEIIQPQGIYKNFEYDSKAKEKVCKELGIPLDSKLIINVGYADLRKGFDIFLNVATQMSSEKKHVHFLWIGGLAPDMNRWVYSDLSEQSKLENFHSIGYSNTVEDYFSACDCLFLSSREDPYPSVVLEAMSVGKPVVIFENATGLDEVVSKNGLIVDRNDIFGIVDALNVSINTVSPRVQQQRVEFVKEHYQFDEYCFYLLQLLLPEIKKVSVVVPNYNYKRYIESRLQSVFDQTYPVFETIILDDCSSDNSVEVIEEFIETSGRIVKLRPNDTNSGNTFKQWDKGLSKVRGDYLWIAEADDLADSRFLHASVSSFSGDTVLSFTDSVQVDTDGEVTAESYSYYYKTIAEDLLSESFSLPGRELVKQALSVKNPIMNVSSVLWRTSALKDSLRATKDEVVSRKLVGDWRLYIETLSVPNAAVSYIHRSLNTHRRHASSVTHSLDNQLHLEEIESIHRHLLESYDLDQAIKDAMAFYIEELELQFDIDKAA